MTADELLRLVLEERDATERTIATVATVRRRERRSGGEPA